MDQGVEDLRARLEFGDLTRVQLAAAAFAGHPAARALLGEEGQVRDDAVTLRGVTLRGTIAKENPRELVLEPAARRVPQRDIERVERDALRWPGECHEHELWAADLERIGREALVRACVAAARLVLPHHEAIRKDEPTGRWAVEAAEAWLAARSPAEERLAQERAERAEALRGRAGPPPAWAQRLLEAARQRGLETAGLEGVAPEHWISVLEDELSPGLSGPVTDEAWTACAAAAWSVVPADRRPESYLFRGLLHPAVRVAGPAAVRRAIDAALRAWALGG